MLEAVESEIKVSDYSCKRFCINYDGIKITLVCTFKGSMKDTDEKTFEGKSYEQW